MLQRRDTASSLVGCCTNKPPEPPFTGIGAMLEPQPSKEGYPQVHAVLPDSPAAQAGLKIGDLLIRIDGLSGTEMSADQAVERIRGEAGRPVRLTVRSGDQERELTLTRRTIQPPTVPQIRHIFEPNSRSGYVHAIEIKRGERFVRISEDTITVAR
jgi:C-terminal processing protease CtpA/Prc